MTNGEIMFHATFLCRASGSNSQEDWEAAAIRYEAVKADRDAKIASRGRREAERRGGGEVNHQKFIYRKKQIIRDRNVIYMWELIDKQTKNGVHFHGAKYDETLLKESHFLCGRNSFGFSTYGIERHAATGQGTPSHTDCQVTGGNCWHDGTSLYAEERLGHVNPDDCDSEVWFVLEQFYASHFETEVLYA